MGVELTVDPAMTARVRRQTAVSAVALGVITLLAAAADAHDGVLALLAAGWVLMPALLSASISRPRLRYGLVVPATLVSAGLLALLATALPDDPAGSVGWMLITGGVLSGATLGGWFWYRLLPVPAALDPPLAPGRWALIAGHVGLVVTGIALVGLGQLG